MGDSTIMEKLTYIKLYLRKFPQNIDQNTAEAPPGTSTET